MRKLVKNFLLLSSLAVSTLVVGQGNNCKPTIIDGEKSPQSGEEYRYIHSCTEYPNDLYRWEIENALFVDGVPTDENHKMVTEKIGREIDIVWDETPTGRIKVISLNPIAIEKIRGIGSILVTKKTIINPIRQDNYSECGGDFSQENTTELFSSVPEPSGILGEIFANHKIDFDKGRRYVPVSVSILKCNGQLSISWEDVYRGIELMNFYYVNANIKFILCNINVIDETLEPNVCEAWNLNMNNEPINFSKYSIANTMNIFIPYTIYNSVGGIGGYFSGGGMYVNNAGSFANSTTPTHETGHFFSLKHTHIGNFTCGTNEPVQRRDYNGNGVLDCYETGDYLCDTKADPNGYSGCQYRTQCQFAPWSSSTKPAPSPFDAYGERYDPDYTNIMAYTGNLVCSTKKLSAEQYKRINYNLLKVRSNIIFKGFNLNLNSNGTVSITFHPSLNQYQEVYWSVRNTSCMGPHCGPSGYYNLTNGNTFTFPSSAFFSCNEYEVTVTYDVCGEENITETQTIKINNNPDFHIASILNVVQCDNDLSVTFNYNKIVGGNVSLNYKLKRNGTVINSTSKSGQFAEAYYFLKERTENLTNIIPASSPSGEYEICIYSTGINGAECLLVCKTFTIYEAIATPIIVMPNKYCSGKNNIFSVSNPQYGLNYCWQLTNVVYKDRPGTYTLPQVCGIDKTEYTPDFGYFDKNMYFLEYVDGPGEIESFTINLFVRDCKGNTVYATPVTVNPVSYQGCIGAAERGNNEDPNTGESFSIKVLPNPANNHVTIQFTTDEGESKNIKIVDAYGMERKNENTNKSTLTINVADLPLGIYSIIATKNSEVAVKHLQVGR